MRSLDGAVATRELYTERLVLRSYDRGDTSHRGDIDTLHELFTDSEIRRYLLDDTVVSREWVEEELARDAGVRQEHGIGQYLIFERSPRERSNAIAGGQAWDPSSASRSSQSRPIGFAGFRPFFEPPELQLIYGLHPSAWGHGYATEAVRALLRVAFEELGHAVVVASTDPPNQASIRVMERAGMTFVEQYRRAGKVSVVYRVARQRHLASSARGRLTLRRRR